MNSLYKQAKQKSESIPCELIKLIELEDDIGQVTWEIKVMKGSKLTKSCMGIHIESIEDLDDAIETAARDRFARIYVYGGVK